MPKEYTPVWAQGFEGGYSPLDKDEQAFVDSQNKKHNQSDKKPSRQKVSDGTAKYQKDFTSRELDQRRAEAKERAESHINSGGTYQREDGSIVDISTSAPANVTFGPQSSGSGASQETPQPTTAFTDPASDSSGSSSSSADGAWDMVPKPGSSFNPYEAVSSYDPYA